MKFRSTTSRMNYKDRHLAIKALEKVRVRKLCKTLSQLKVYDETRRKHLLTCLVAVIVKCRQDNADPRETFRRSAYCRQALLKYTVTRSDIKIVKRVLLQTLIMPPCEREPPTKKKNRKIDDLSENDAYQLTRFTKDQLRKLLLHLRIPARIVVKGGHVFTGEETLIVCLTKIAHAEPWTTLIKDKFGGNPDFWCYAFRWLMKYIYETHYHKFTGDSFAREWADEVDDFRELIWKKMKVSPCEIERYMNADGEDAEINIVNVAFELFRIFGFIDDTLLHTSRPGSGPEGNHEHAPRRHDAYYIQRAFFSGYLKAHGIKLQTMFLPNGMWGSLFCTSIRHNDKGTVNISGIIDQLMDNLQHMDGTNVYPALWGDDIFELSPVLLRRLKPADGLDINDFQKAMDKRLSSLRQSIELGYGLVFKLFKILRKKDLFKLYKGADEARHLASVCFFLCNCYTCFNGNVANSMFDSQPPTLEEYLPLNDV